MPVLAPEPQAAWPFPEARSSEKSACAIMAQHDAKACAERRCAAAGICRHRLWLFKENPMPVAVQGGPFIRDDTPAQGWDEIDTDCQIELLEYIENNSPTWQGLIDATSSAQRIILQMVGGTCNSDMVKTLLDELSSISVASDELFGDMYDIAHPEEADEEEEAEGPQVGTLLTGPEDCGRGLPMARCIESACDFRCEIPQRK